ncbi:LysR family transcriptional regulator [Naasia lichenicola]|uniref:LysR family transcriptional regulator n=1 Tax=Naasia lichenicola TaxID=2565933 RepID=UPI00130D7E90|nr:LysR family transcriptional regulator [Naasia lichenicola]
MPAGLARLDLNLLVSLDALLTERSVTRAAGKLGLSQPALSASLARLRLHFADEILARDGNSYRLTPLAVRLAEQTSSALDAARKVFANEALFDPRTSTREFSIYGSDFGIADVGSAVTAVAADQAPGVRFRFMHHTPAIVDDAQVSLRTVDGMLLPRGFITGFPFVDIYQDEWVCLVAAENEQVGDVLTPQNLAELPWVYTYHSRSVSLAAARQLQELGIEPIVDCVVEGFLTLPFFIAGTNRLGLVQSRMADRMLAMGDLRIVALPFDPPTIDGALWWHPMHSEDPGHQWMRDVFLAASRLVTAG